MPDPAAPESRASLMTRRNVVIGGLLACASGVALARQPAIANPKVKPESFEAWVPARFGDWRVVSQSGVVLPPPDALRDRLYDNLVTRVYVGPDEQPIMLLLAYNNAQDGVVQVHRPEVCYPVGGFELTETRPIDMPLGGTVVPANIFTATGPDRVEQVAYFTRLGDSFPRTWLEQRLSVSKANLAGDIPDGMMMRVSLLGRDQRQAEGMLREFSAEFFSRCHPDLQRLLTGMRA